MKVSNMFTGAMVMAAMAAATVGNAASLNYSGGTYTQDFDGLPNTGSETPAGKGPHAFSDLGTFTSTGMEGWYGANPAGSADATEFRAQDGSQSGSAGRGVVSFGIGGSSERALGTLATSNQVNAFGLVLINNTSDTFSSLDISFVGEQWRRGGVPAPNAIAFSYGLGATASAILDGGLTDVPQLLFTGPNTQVAPTEVALDGNNAANQTALSHTIGGLNWQPGQSLVLRWLGQDQSGQDDGLAIDNLSLTANAAPIPEPSGLVIAGLGLMGLLGFRRRRRS